MVQPCRHILHTLKEKNKNKKTSQVEDLFRGTDVWEQKLPCTHSVTPLATFTLWQAFPFENPHTHTADIAAGVRMPPGTHLRSEWGRTGCSPFCRGTRNCRGSWCRCGRRSSQRSTRQCLRQRQWGVGVGVLLWWENVTALGLFSTGDWQGVSHSGGSIESKHCWYRYQYWYWYQLILV